MNILVANGSLSGIDGSINYSYATIKELLKRGYNVDGFAYSREDGSCFLTEEKLLEDGVSLFIENPPTKNYDLILSSGHTTLHYLTDIKGFRIQTLHGAHVEEEQPNELADAFVSISEEAQNNATSLGYNSVIIRNGVDVERFTNSNPINKELKKILSLSHSDELNNRLSRICDKLNIEFIYHHKKQNPIFNIEDKINEVDLVITIGRGVYEAMSCGRVVFILDNRRYIDKGSIGDGIVTDETIDYFLRNNCSGRYTNKVFNDDDIIQELLKYDYRLGEFNREYVKENLTIEKSVNQYLKLYEQLR